MINTPKYIVLHCTDVPWTAQRDQFNSVNLYHKGRLFPESTLGLYVGYHRLITGGKNYKCKEDWEEGAHTQGHNFESLGIAVGFDGDIEYPHPDDAPLLKAQIEAWRVTYGNLPIHFHREFNTAKTCPGTLITEEWLQNLLAGPAYKPEDQEEKQKEILKQKLTLLQKLYAALLKLKLKNL